jgi:hypothetical protein
MDAGERATCCLHAGGQRFESPLAAWLPRLVGLVLPAGWTGGTFVLAAWALTSLAIGLVIAWFLPVEVRRATT